MAKTSTRKGIGSWLGSVVLPLLLFFGARANTKVDVACWCKCYEDDDMETEISCDDETESKILECCGPSPCVDDLASGCDELDGREIL